MNHRPTFLPHCVRLYCVISTLSYGRVSYALRDRHQLSLSFVETNTVQYRGYLQYYDEHFCFRSWICKQWNTGELIVEIFIRKKSNRKSRSKFRRQFPWVPVPSISEIRRLVNEFRIKVSLSKKRDRKPWVSFRRNTGWQWSEIRDISTKIFKTVFTQTRCAIVICTLIHKATLFETTRINICTRTPGRKQCCYGTVL